MGQFYWSVVWIWSNLIIFLILDFMRIKHKRLIVVWPFLKNVLKPCDPFIWPTWCLVLCPVHQVWATSWPQQPDQDLTQIWTPCLFWVMWDTSGPHPLYIWAKRRLAHIKWSVCGPHLHVSEVGTSDEVGGTRTVMWTRMDRWLTGSSCDGVLMVIISAPTQNTSHAPKWWA